MTSVLRSPDHVAIHTIIRENAQDFNMLKDASTSTRPDVHRMFSSVILMLHGMR